MESIGCGSSKICPCYQMKTVKYMFLSRSMSMAAIFALVSTSFLDGKPPTTNKAWDIKEPLRKDLLGRLKGKAGKPEISVSSRDKLYQNQENELEMAEAAEERLVNKKISQGKTSPNVDLSLVTLWKFWLENPTAFQTKIKLLMNLKTKIKSHLLEAAPMIRQPMSQQLFQLFHRVLNQSEEFLIGSVHHFDRSLNVGYGSIKEFRENTEHHLKTLQKMLIDEDLLLADIGHLEKVYEQVKESQDNITHLSSFWSSILENMKGAADELESELADPAFDMMLKSGNKPNIETVIKVKDMPPAIPMSVRSSGGEESRKSSDSSITQQDDILRLVDSQNNQYVLSKSKDTTIPIEDVSLVKDIISVILLGFVFTYLCHMSNIPIMFGYILTGVTLGPSGINIIKNLVQLETLGEFGVFFILFSVGLEFSFETLRRLWRVAFITSFALLVVMLMLALGLSYLIGFGARQCIFVAVCASLSSTPLAVKLLHGGSHREYVQVDPAPTLIAILVVQDIMLGLIIALLPAIAAHNDDIGIISLAKTLAPVIVSLAVLAMISASISLVLRHHMIAFFNVAQTEIFLLATVSTSFFLLLVTDFMKLPMELGCLIAGVIISSRHQPQLMCQIESTIRPVKDFFSCIFFASIGLHVYPSFLTYEVSLLVPAALFVVLTKFACCLVIIRPIQRKVQSTAWIAAAGLAHISEFTFVLGSRARVMGIISREVYLLVLSVTMLSLFMAPVLWKFALYRVKLLHFRIS